MSHLYQSADFFLFRGSLFSFNETQPSYEHLWNLPKEKPDFLEAIAIASPGLYRSFCSLLEAEKDEQKRKKIYTSFLKYFRRMAYRATPFGAFSFVGWGEFQKTTNLEFHKNEIRRSIRPDMEWIDGVITLCHREYSFVKHLTVMCSQEIEKSDSRYVIKKMKKDGEHTAISIKSTTFTDQLFILAKQPIKYENLEESLHEIFKNFDRQNSVNCLWDIFQQGFLQSELFSPFHKPFQFDTFINRIAEIEKNIQSPQITTILSSLVTLERLITQYSASTWAEGLPYLKQLIELSQPWEAKHTIQVDSYLPDRKVILSENIKSNLEAVADCILLFTHEYSYYQNVEEYLQKFMQKYGTNRLVPIKELTNEVTGLGVLDKFSNNASFTRRLVDSLLQDFTKEVNEELCIDQLVHSNQELIEKIRKIAPLSIELFFEIFADSSANLESGDYIIALNPSAASTQACSTFGRFLHLWDESRTNDVKEFLKKEESLVDQIAVVEVCFPTALPRSFNVSFHKSTRAFRLDLHSIDCSEHTLNLEDIFIGVKEGRLYLFSKTLNKEIKVVTNTAVNYSKASPLIQFMFAVSNKSYCSFTPSIFSPLFHLPYLPRIRYKNIILSPARWYFTFDSLKIDHKMNKKQVEEILKQAFAIYKVPTTLFLTEFDNRLLLNHSVEIEFKIILDHFMTKKEVIVYESFSSLTSHLIKSQSGYHIGEFVLPLIKRSAVPDKQQSFPPIQQVSVADRVKFIGIHNWLYVKLFLPQRNMDDFIATHLRSLSTQLMETGLIDKWFYIRYNEEKAHLRLRLHGTKMPPNAELLQTLSSWGMQLVTSITLSDFSIHNYDREIERYGGPDLINLAEELFYDDSIFCMSLLATISKSKLPIPIEFFSALVAINILHQCYSNTAEMLNVLTVQADDLKGLSGLRTELKTFSTLLSCYLSPQLNESELVKISPIVSSLFQQLRNASPRIAFMSKQYDAVMNQGIQWNTKSHLVNSLIHMHCNRLLGIDRSFETKARIIAHYALQQQLRLSERVS